MAGRWEFPGGKCEPGESIGDCLRRELDEELGVNVDVGDALVTIDHAYPERTVRLHFHRCHISGEPQARLSQDIRWATRQDLRTLPFPEADKALIELLTR